MFLRWLKCRRRRRLLATPFPEAWHDYLRRNFWHYAYLSAEEQARLRDLVRIFIAERSWEGCRGFVIADEVRVTIAAQACLLILELDIDHYRSVSSILVYPGGFRTPFRQLLDSGEVIEGMDDALGEIDYRGPIVLAWDEVLQSGQGVSGGPNPVLHEFAHQLDSLDGIYDGTPLLTESNLYPRWREVMSREFENLGKAADQGLDTVIDPYGATDESEFFAVATECFFEMPIEMEAQHAALYDLLRVYYRQDPAARLRRGSP